MKTTTSTWTVFLNKVQREHLERFNYLLPEGQTLVSLELERLLIGLSLREFAENPSKEKKKEGKAEEGLRGNKSLFCRHSDY